MKSADKVIDLVEEIKNTLTEASDLKPGDHVMFKDGTHMAGTPAVVAELMKDGKHVMVRIGGGDGLMANVAVSDLKKAAGHPGVGSPKA